MLTPRLNPIPTPTLPLKGRELNQVVHWHRVLNSYHESPVTNNGFYSFCAYLFSNKLLVTTETLEKAMAKPANSGLRTIPKAG